MKTFKMSLAVLAIVSLIGLATFIYGASQWGWCNVPDRAKRTASEPGTAYLLQALVEGTNSQVSLATSFPRLESVFNQRREKYEKNVGSLGTNFLYQAIFVVLALYVLLKDKDHEGKYTVPLVNLKVPATIALRIVAIALIILWAQFGFMLSETIDLRIGLWRLAESLESPLTVFGKELTNKAVVSQLHLSFTNNTDQAWTNAVYNYGHARVLHDAGFFDGWFDCFRSSFTLRSASPFIVKAHLILWGVFCGIANGCLLTCVWKWEDSTTATPWDLLLNCIAFGASVGYLLATHFGFFWPGGHSNWLQAIMLGVAAAVFPMLEWGKEIPRWLAGKMNALFSPRQVP